MKPFVFKIGRFAILRKGISGVKGFGGEWKQWSRWPQLAVFVKYKKTAPLYQAVAKY